MLYARFSSTTTAATVALAIATASLSPVTAQTSFAASPNPTAPSPTTSTVHLERARSLAVLGQFREAKAEYSRAAALMRVEGRLPTEALWQIAEIYFGEENHRRAADVLSDLAREAEVFGDPVVQARALLEASVLYQHAGLTEAMLRSANRLQQLRASPYLPDDLRAAIETRVGLS